MKFLPSLATLSLTLLSVSTLANAQQEMQRGKDISKGQNRGEIQRHFLRRNEPQRVDGSPELPAQREASTIPQFEELKPAPAQVAVPMQARERLSPEERRQLRRDINAAGRDIYRRNKPD